MKTFKQILKMCIGVAVLVFAVWAFVQALQSENLENGNLRDWRAAGLGRRTVTAQLMIASDENLDLLVKCVDKMATEPGSAKRSVRDAISLCYTGILVNQNNYSQSE